MKPIVCTAYGPPEVLRVERAGRSATMSGGWLSALGMICDAGIEI